MRRIGLVCALGLLIGAEAYPAYGAAQTGAQQTAAGQTGAAPVAQAGGSEASAPRFQLVRSVSGSKGELEAGRYVILDPRSVFYVPEDHEVIVYFEWEGPLGPHHIEGLWKDPGGKTTVISSFDYTSTTRRFAGHWSLLLAAGLNTGLWTVDARIDGESAGSASFQILAAPRPAGAASVTAPRLLEPEAIYELARAATVGIQRFNADHAPTGTGSGFLIGNDLALTGFEVIDGASFVRVTLPDGAMETLDSVVAWNRLEDWAVLKLPIAGSHELSVAQPAPWKVGDRCYTLDEPEPGNRALATGSVTGRRAFGQLGERIDLNFSLQPGADGSPVLSDTGHVIGMVLSYSLLPGLSSLEGAKNRLGAMLEPDNLVGQDNSFGVAGSLALPVSVVRVPAAGLAPTPFAVLLQRGEFTPPITPDPDLFRGTLAQKITRNGPYTEAVDNRFEFSHADGQIMVAADWDGQKKSKSSLLLRLCDLEGRPVTASPPVVLKMSKGRKSSTLWTLPIANLPAGTYRVDMLRDGRCIWRTFFRLTP
jgi:Trypsin-like peptidase domain